MVPPIGSCRECSSPLAPDQRWCVDCGARRGPVSDAMRHLIAGTTVPEPSLAAVPEPAPRATFTMPSPRSAAVAISAVLAFGVVVGSVVSPTAQSAAAPMVVAVSQPPAAAPPVQEAPAAVEEAPAVDEAPVEAPPAEAQTIYLPAPDTPAAPAPKSPPPPLPVPPLPKLPPIQHVFVVMLTNHGYDAAFGPDSKGPYLAKTLPEQGELVQNYYSVAGGSLANEIALVSGQGPNPDTTANCPHYTDVTPGTPDAEGQAQGTGCVYPADTKTIADQLFGLGYTWKAYVEDLGNGGEGSPQTCRHPDPGADDPYHDARPGDAYVTWRNPFVYFHSLLDPPASTCNTSDVDLKQLTTDLQQVGDTPAVSLIVPNRCHDGSETACAPDQPAGLPASDTFLQTLIPQIQESPGYKQGGLIAITFDQAPQDVEAADTSSCCPVQPTGGGGRVGMVLLSPYILPKSVNSTGSYNHFSLLRSIEELFALDPLGHAKSDTLPVFDDSIYTGYNTDS